MCGKAAACAFGWSGTSAEAPGSVPVPETEQKHVPAVAAGRRQGAPRGGCGLRSAMAESSRGKLYLKLHQRQDGAGARPAARGAGVHAPSCLRGFTCFYYTFTVFI